MEIETHFETRKEYVIIGNELASLEEKHKKDKEEAERKKKELEAKMASMISNINNLASTGGVGPIYVPTKHSDQKKEVPNDKFDPSKINVKRKNLKEESELSKPLKELNLNIVEQQKISSNKISTINNGNYFKKNKV